MEAFDILITAMSSLVMLIVIHLAVFGVVRWMYPPYSEPSRVRFAPPPFTEPAHIKQEINVPTHAPIVPVEAIGEERRTDGGKTQSTAAERPAWLVAVDPKTLDT
jgi:hypothetical protein